MPELLLFSKPLWRDLPVSRPARRIGVWRIISMRRDFYAARAARYRQ